MNRSTSAEAYHALEGKGVLRGLRAEVEHAFERFGPGTAAEVLSAAALSSNLNLTRARVSELAADGLLVEMPARKCKRTGRRAIVWRALDDDELPCPRPKITRVAFDENEVQLCADILAGKITVLSPRIDELLRKVLHATPTAVQS